MYKELKDRFKKKKSAAKSERYVKAMLRVTFPCKLERRDKYGNVGPRLPTGPKPGNNED